MATRRMLPLATAALLAAAALLGLPRTANAQAPPATDAAALTLDEVYALAAARNPMLRASGYRTRAMGAMEASAKLPPDPQLQVGVMNASLPGLRADMPSSMAPAVQLMQMVPLPGKLALSGRIAALETERARADSAEEAWMARSRAAMGFYEIWRADRDVAVMRETVRLLRTFEAVARSMYGAGTGRQADVLRAGVEVARMEAEIARMQAMRAAAVARLNAVLAFPAETPVPAVTFPRLPRELPAPGELRAWADSARPLLRGRTLAVTQAGDRLRLARRELWPDVAVGVQYGQRQDPGMGTERMGSLMLGISLPVFAAQRQLRMRQEAAAMEEMAGAELADARARVHARVGELLAELDRARTLLRLYRAEVLPQAEAAVQSSLASYRVGAVDFMTLVDAQMSVNRFRQEVLALMAEYGLAVAELEMAVGRPLPETPNALAEENP